MAKEVTTPKQSGGGGYTFADKVAAFYLLKMLAGSPPLDPETGQIESAQFEKRVDGWFLDDIVMLLRRVDGERAALAISVKSNSQINASGFPAEFTRAAWEQRLHKQTDKFDPETDYLSLATSPLDPTVKSALESLVTKALDADPSTFAARVVTAGYENAIGRAIFDSLMESPKRETAFELPQIVTIAEESTNTIVEMVRQQHEISHQEAQSSEVQAKIARRIKRCRGFQPLHIRAGFSWLERIEDAKDNVERGLIIATLENLLHGFLRPLGGIEEALFDDEDHSTFFSVPGQWDTWIFDLVVSIIPRLKETESARRLWEPILSFGLDRVHWVDAFISRWFLRGGRVAGSEENFFREWKAMIAYAWTCENWRETTVRRRRSDDELFRNLMGLNGVGIVFEDEKYRPYVNSMKPEYDKWLDAFLPGPDTTAAFARFLTSPSSIDFLRDGVRRLADVSREFEEWHWRDHYRLDSALLRLLEHDWSKNARLITKDADIRRQFSTILKSMTDRQIPRALELQDKMLRAV